MYRLMIVDDSAIIRNKITRAFNNDKFNIVCTAKNGLEAVEMCRKYMPDIATMDLTMPGMDGLNAIPALLAVKPNLQILVVSALSDQSTGLEALELGASGFLVKPFTETSLQKALNDIIEFMEDDED